MKCNVNKHQAQPIWRDMSTMIFTSTNITFTGKSYVTNFAVPGSLFGGPETYWGKNAAQKEGKEFICIRPSRHLTLLRSESFLSDINEQRSAIG